MSARTRAAKGAALLDQECPYWFTRVDITTLDITSKHDCTLGQVYGDWDTGMDILNSAMERNGPAHWWDEYSDQYGFCPRFVVLPPAGLNKAWRREIIDRRIANLTLRNMIAAKAKTEPVVTK